MSKLCAIRTCNQQNIPLHGSNGSTSSRLQARGQGLTSKHIWGKGLLSVHEAGYSEMYRQRNLSAAQTHVTYSRDELQQILGSVGENVSVHRSVMFFSPGDIHIGSSVRIDCYSVLSAGSKGIQIGDFVHLGAGVCLFGASGKIDIGSFCGLSSKVTVYTANDDYTEGFLTNPTVPEKYRKLREADVVLQKHALVGTSSVIMPGVTLGLAASVGALSFVNDSVPDFAIALGNPLRLVGKRPARILGLEREFLSEIESWGGCKLANGPS